MGFVLEFLVYSIWDTLVEAATADKPWWVRPLIVLSPLFLLIALIGLVSLAVG